MVNESFFAMEMAELQYYELQNHPYHSPAHLPHPHSLCLHHIHMLDQYSGDQDTEIDLGGTCLWHLLNQKVT